MGGERHEEEGLSVLGSAKGEAVVEPASAKGHAPAHLLGGDEHNTLATALRAVSTGPVVPALSAIHAQAHLLHGVSVHRGRASR